MGIIKYYTGRLLREVLPGAGLARVNRVRRKLGSRVEQVRKQRAVTRYGLFGAQQLHSELEAAGIIRGRVLLVHSSLGRFYNYDGTAAGILKVLDDLVGPDGTLLMPAHPASVGTAPFVFDVRKSAAQTGILCELFRRQPGVKRSLHPTHSACGRGPLAEILLADHHKSPLSCGPLSPYARLAEYGGHVLGLGVSPVFNMCIHVVEDLDLDRYPRPMYQKQPLEYIIINEAGCEMRLTLCRRNYRVLATLDMSRVIHHLSKRALCCFTIHGVPAFVCDAASFIAELTALRDRGLLVYA